MPLLEFTPNPDNLSTTTINGVQFSIPALTTHHYELYTNNTLSNGSNCYLVFDAFKPSMLDNGTWLHATTCYVPYYGVSLRGKVSIACGVLYGLSIMFTLMNLKRHGAQFLREDRRFRLVGRRWQWYWMLFVSACAMISLFTGVDVDRYYLQEMPIILQSLFFTLMVPSALAMVWEGTRHWGSWEERQVVDADPYGMPQDDWRNKIEFYAPLVFYLFAWLDFFMTVPRSWTAVQRQNTPEQSWFVARPAATDSRNKAGAILAICAWAVILFSLQHSIRVYKHGKIAACPKKLLLNIGFLGVRVAYNVAAAWSWDLSIFNQNVSIGWPFGLGYAPVLLILIVYNISGLREENEDKQLIKQRVVRGRVQDAELNIVRKPSWWGRNMAGRFASEDERLKKMTTLTTEVPGGRPTARNEGRAVEMGSLGVRQRSATRRAQAPFFDENPVEGRETDTYRSVPVGGTSPAASVRIESTGQQHTKSVPLQRIVSMLDV